jgi:hypothetical protein
MAVPVSGESETHFTRSVAQCRTANFASRLIRRSYKASADAKAMA